MRRNGLTQTWSTSERDCVENGSGVIEQHKPKKRKNRKDKPQSRSQACVTTNSKEITDWYTNSKTKKLLERNGSMSLEYIKRYIKLKIDKLGTKKKKKKKTLQVPVERMKRRRGQLRHASDKGLGR